MYLSSCLAEPVIFQQTNVSLNHSCLALCSSFCRILLHVKIIKYCTSLLKKRGGKTEIYITNFTIKHSCTSSKLVHYKYNDLIITIAGMHKEIIQCLDISNCHAFKPNWNTQNHPKAVHSPQRNSLAGSAKLRVIGFCLLQNPDEHSLFLDPLVQLL